MAVLTVSMSHYAQLATTPKAHVYITLAKNVGCSLRNGYKNAAPQMRACLQLSWIVTNPRRRDCVTGYTTLTQSFISSLPSRPIYAEYLADRRAPATAVLQDNATTNINIVL